MKILMKMAMESAFSFTIREGYRTILMNSTIKKGGLHRAEETCRRGQQDRREHQ